MRQSDQIRVTDGKSSKSDYFLRTTMAIGVTIGTDQARHAVNNAWGTTANSTMELVELLDRTVVTAGQLLVGYEKRV